MFRKSRRARAAVIAVLIALIVGGGLAAAAPLFFQGFEEDTDGWFGTIHRVASGSNGIPSAAGDFHAEAGAGDFTRWGGYSAEFPVDGYTTSIDIYLDVDAGFANDTRFDYTSAISTPANTHRRDFIITGGFYNDNGVLAPGSGNRFVFSTSNNSPGWPGNPARSPYVIATTGWYTFTHTFYNSGGGVLAVDIAISDSDGVELSSWTLSDPTDIIGVTVGGNRYGWFVTSGFPFLAIDNSTLTTGPGDPTSKDDCKNGGWESFGFKNQGQCIQFVNTGKDSR